MVVIREWDEIDAPFFFKKKRKRFVRVCIAVFDDAVINPSVTAALRRSLHMRY